MRGMVWYSGMYIFMREMKNKVLSRESERKMPLWRSMYSMGRISNWVIMKWTGFVWFRIFTSS
jgi:hypothetical protein